MELYPHDWSVHKLNTRHKRKAAFILIRHWIALKRGQSRLRGRSAVRPKSGSVLCIKGQLGDAIGVGGATGSTRIDFEE